MWLLEMHINYYNNKDANGLLHTTWKTKKDEKHSG